MPFLAISKFKTPLSCTSEVNVWEVGTNLRRYGVPHRVESINSITIFFSKLTKFDNFI